MGGTTSSELGKASSTTSRSRLSHVRLLTTASLEKRRLLGRSQRLVGLLPTRQANEEIFPHRSGEVDHRSKRNRAREKTTNLRAGSIIERTSTKFGVGWYSFWRKRRENGKTRAVFGKSLGKQQNRFG